MYYEAIDRWNDSELYLDHHGVKGMKWGVRHDRVSIGIGNRGKKQTPSLKRNSKIAARKSVNAKKSSPLKTAAKIALGVAVGGAAVYSVMRGREYASLMMEDFMERNEGEERITAKAVKNYVTKDLVKNVKMSALKPITDARKERYKKSAYAQAKKMSDEELHKRINRINLEQNYINAVSRDRDARKNATRSTLAKVGTAALGTIGAAAIGTQLGNFAKNAAVNKAQDKFPILRKPNQKYPGAESLARRAEEEARRKQKEKEKMRRQGK